MRRILLLLLIALGGLNVLSAQQRTEQEALDIAKVFLQKKYKTVRSNIRRVSPLKDVIKQVPVVKDTAKWAPFYIWNDESSHSFVIVSGDERMPKILGYAPNIFDEGKMPDALSHLLSDYAAQYNELQKLPAADSLPDISSGTPDESPEVVLETARWGQGKPFNNDCPENSAAGCVATAMSIVMRYHNWPLQGEGSHEYVWFGSNGFVTLSANFSQAVYDWENMPLDYDTYTEEQGKAVAQLMYHAGISVDMYYGYSASGALFENAKIALSDYFQYSPLMACVKAENYTQEEWLSRMKMEIDAGRPVLYSGTSASTNTGHAFVVDGYQDNLLHINWGWNGYYNGFFALGYLTPGDGNGGYNSDQAAIVNIKPYDEKEPISPVVLTRQEGFGLVTMDCRDVKKDVDFNFMILAMADYPYDGSYTADYQVALVDKNGNIKEIVGQSVVYHNGSANGIPCKSSQDAVLGDSLVLFTQRTGTDELLPVFLESGNLAQVPALGNEPQTANVIWDDPDSLLYFAWSQSGEFEGKPILGATVFFRLTLPEGNICRVETSDGKKFYMENDFSSIHWVKNDMIVRLSLIDMNKRVDNVKLYLREPGTLEQVVSESNMDMDLVKSLILSGKMDARDFLWLNKYKLLEALDLSQVEIMAFDKYPAHQIPDNSFEDCSSLKSFKMPVLLSSIGNNAFMVTGLESIVIPATVNEIGLNAFWGCSNLKEVTVKNPEPVWISWCVFTGTGREAGVLHVPQGCLDAYRNASEWNMFPEIIDDIPNEFLTFSIDGIYYQNIPGYEGTKYACVIPPPEGVTYSGDLRIPEFVVHEGTKYVVREISSNAFAGSDGLTSLFMSDSIRVIGDYALEICNSLEQVRLSDNIEVLPVSALGYLPALKKVNLPESLVRIEDYALYRNQVETLHFPKGLSNLAPTALTQMSELREITVDPENSAFTVEEGLLMNIDKNKLLLRPEMLPSDEFEVPSSITIIGEFSISGIMLKKIIIPETVVRLEVSSITDCDLLDEIHVLSPIPPFADENAFDYKCLENTILKVPVGAKAVYQQAVGWSKFKNIEEVDATSVVLPEADVLKIEYTSNGLQVTVGTPVDYSIYSLEGILMQQGHLDGGLNQIPVRGNKNLIIKIGNQTYKIVNRF